MFKYATRITSRPKLTKDYYVRDWNAQKVVGKLRGVAIRKKLTSFEIIVQGHRYTHIYKAGAE